MTLNNNKSSVQNVAEYQAAGLPWVTSSNVTTASLQINFPMVTTTICVKNNWTNAASSSLRFGYSSNGVANSNYFLLEPGQTLSVSARTKSIFLSATSGSLPFSVHAGLTTIDPKIFPVLTGSAIYGTAGAVSGSYGYGLFGGPGVSGTLGETNGGIG